MVYLSSTFAVLSLSLALVLYFIVRRHKRAVDSLQDEPSLAEARLLASPDPTLIIDAEGRISRFNDAAEYLFGLRRDQVVGHELSMLFHCESKDLPEHVLGTVLSFPAPRRGCWNKYVGRTENGNGFPMQVRARSVYHENKPCGVVTVRDLTSDKLPIARGLTRRSWNSSIGQARCTTLGRSRSTTRSFASPDP